MNGRRTRASRGGRYAIEGVLGRGGMSTVYLAWDAGEQRRVALKALAEPLAGDPEHRARFLREGRLAALLVHPNVVRVLDVGADEQGLYLVMEHVPGPTLAGELRRRGRLPPGEAVAIVGQVCAGLDHVHRAGLVHRDVTPGNILLTPSGAAKLSDFGIARSLEETRVTQAGTVLGTAAYLAPEQARGEPVTPAADLYATGVVLYELLAGRPPFAGDSLPELLLRREREPAPALGEHAPGVPPALEAVVTACLAPDPALRPHSAAALGEELEAALDEAPTRRLATPAAAATTRVLPVRRGRGRRRGLLAAALVAALTGALLARDVLEEEPALRASAGRIAQAAATPAVAERDRVPVAPLPPPLPQAAPEPCADEDDDDREPSGRGKGKKKGHDKDGGGRERGDEDEREDCD